MNYIKLRYGNSCDMGNVYYAGGFQNTLFLDAEIGKPEYLTEVEGYTNGDGVFIKTFERLVKQFKFQCYVPEYLVDALHFMALHDNVIIYFTNGLYTSVIRNIEVSAEWDGESNDCMALVTVKFLQDDQVNKNLCCVNL